MTITYTLDHVIASVEDVSVEVAPKSEMISGGTTRKGAASETVYTLGSGDNAYPATVTYRSELQVRGGRPVRSISVTFETWAVKTNSVTGEEVREKVNSTIAFLLPAGFTIEIADLDDLLGNVVSYCYPSVTTKVRSTDWLNALQYGSTAVV
jgi:hypothetical protein